MSVDEGLKAFHPICLPMKGLRDLNVYRSCKNNRPYSGLNVYFHCSTLFRPRSTAMRLLSFIEHSYVMPWGPIWVSMKGSRHFNVYWSSNKNRPYSGLDVYFHCSTLFRPRSTAMRLLSFIAHSYVMPWEPIWVSMKGSRHFNVYWRSKKIGHTVD